MKRLWLLLLLVITISCTQVKEFPDAPYIGITYGTIQTRMLPYGIDINKDYIHALQAHHANVIRIFISDSNWIMFHPEMMRKENPVFENIFAVFIKEAQAYMNK